MQYTQHAPNRGGTPRTVSNISLQVCLSGSLQYDDLIWFVHSNQLLLAHISPLHQISRPISSKSMISMSLEEGSVMYINVGTVTVHQRRFEFGP